MEENRTPESAPAPEPAPVPVAAPASTPAPAPAPKSQILRSLVALAGGIVLLVVLALLMVYAGTFFG